MLSQEETRIAINKLLEMIYCLYMKELKAGNIGKDKNSSSFGKICKKRNPLKNNDDPTLFNYGK